MLGTEIIREGVGDGDDAAIAAACKEGAKETPGSALWEIMNFKDRRLTEKTAQSGGLGVAGIEQVGAPGFDPTDSAKGVIVTTEREYVGSQVIGNSVERP
jgi:hypothetical protein